MCAAVKKNEINKQTKKGLLYSLKKKKGREIREKQEVGRNRRKQENEVNI